MAHNPPNFSTWSSSSEAANLCYEFGPDSHMRSDVSMDMDQSVWQHLERVTALHYPTRAQIQLPDVLGSVDSQYDSGQVLEFQSAYNDVSNDLLNGFPEVSPSHLTTTPVINRIPKNTGSLPEDLFPSLDHPVKAPGKVKSGRRRRASARSGTPDGWVASKNLISERRRREKLQKGLITLRELVPMFNMKMDKVSILTDAINHLKDLKRIVEKLESADSNDEDRSIDPKTAQVARSFCAGLGTSDAENESENRKNSSTDGSFCSELLDDSVVQCDYESILSSPDWNLHKIQNLDVTKLDHGVYKLDLICTHQSGVLVQLSQAIEAFVIEVVHTSIVAIASSKVTCTFIVKMSSWNDMTLEDVRVDIKTLLGKSGSCSFPRVML